MSPSAGLRLRYPYDVRAFSLGLGVFALALVPLAPLGCNLLSGVNDLAIGEGATSSGGLPDGGARPPPDSDGGADGGATIDAGDDEPRPPSRLREITFESGDVLGPLGADAVVGMPQIVSGAKAIRGAYSMAVDQPSTLARVNLPPLDDVYVAFTFRPLAPVDDAPTVARITTENGTIELMIDEAKGLIFRSGGVSTGGASQGPSGAYRVAVRVLQTSPTSTRLELFSADLDAPFGGASVIAGPHLGRAMLLELGTFADNNLHASAYDNVIIDASSLPLP